MKTLFKFICGLCVLVPTLVLGQSLNQKQIEELDEIVNNEMELSGAPGAAIAVLKDSSIIYQKAYGLSNVNTKVAVNISTVFHLGSVTKIFTASALLNACEKNSVDIHSPIGNIIVGLSPKLSQITIHQLLSQSSGLLDHWPSDTKYNADILDYFLNFGDSLVCEELISVFSYTNYGYALAGLILAELNNSSYPKAIEELIFEPIKMNNSTFDETEIMLNFFSTGHIEGKSVQHYLTYPLIQPAGGMFSNIKDLSRFASCFMNNGIIYGEQIISKEVIKKMSTPRMPFGVMHQYLSYTGSFYNYGLIDFIYKGTHFIGHAGESSSQNALFAMNPDNKIAFILLSNAGSYPFIESFEKMVETFLPVNEDSQKMVTEEKDYPRFVGRYYSPNISGNKDNIMEIEYIDQKLYIRLSTEQIFQLTSIGKARFKFSNPETKFQQEVGFFEDENGEIKYLNYFWRTSVKE